MSLKQLLKILFAMVLFLGFTFNCSAEQKTSGIVGTVDSAKLLLLHPSMSTYDPYQKAFLKVKLLNYLPSPKDDKNQANVIQEIEKQIQEIENQKDELSRKHSQEIQKAMIQHQEKMKSLATSAQIIEVNEFKILSTSRNQEFFAAMQKFDEKIASLKDAIAKFRLEPGSSFTSSKETQLLIEKLFADIKAAVAKVAQAKGIFVVFDSSFEGIKGLLASNVDRSLPSDLNYAQVFGERASFGFPKDFWLEPGFAEIQRNRIKRWVSQREKILYPFKNLLNSSYVLTGGVDITSEVLQEIFEQYRIPKDVRENVLKGLQ